MKPPANFLQLLNLPLARKTLDIELRIENTSPKIKLFDLFRCFVGNDTAIKITITKAHPHSEITYEKLLEFISQVATMVLTAGQCSPPRSKISFERIVSKYGTVQDTVVLFSLRKKMTVPINANYYWLGELGGKKSVTLKLRLEA